MKDSSIFERYCLNIGFFAIIIGGICYSLFLIQPIACWIMFTGALLVLYGQVKQKYPDTSITIRRLRKYNIIACISLVLSGVFMIENSYHFIMPYFINHIGNYMLYIRVFQNNWVILMLIGALLLVYTTLRIGNELERGHN